MESRVVQGAVSRNSTKAGLVEVLPTGLYFQAALIPKEESNSATPNSLAWATRDPGKLLQDKPSEVLSPSLRLQQQVSSECTHLEKRNPVFSLSLVWQVFNPCCLSARCSQLLPATTASLRADGSASVPAVFCSSVIMALQTAGTGVP